MLTGSSQQEISTALSFEPTSVYRITMQGETNVKATDFHHLSDFQPDSTDLFGVPRPFDLSSFQPDSTDLFGVLRQTNSTDFQPDPTDLFDNIDSFGVLNWTNPASY
jgi:hypothetical protein